MYSFSNLPPRSLFSGVKGIYMIECLPNGKKYIGQSINLYARLRAHLVNLKSNKRVNKHLRAAYLKYGQDAFSITILDVGIFSGDLNRAEKFYIDKYNTTDRSHGYNMCYFNDKGAPRYIESYHQRVTNSAKKIGRADAQVIRELYKEGYDNLEIRTIYKLNKSYLSNILSNKSWKDSTYLKPTPKQRGQFTFEQRKAIDSYLRDGKSMLEIIEIEGVNWSRISRYISFKNSSKRPKINTLVLNKSTGIFYNSISEAAKAETIKVSKLAQWLKFPKRNKSSLILA